MKQQQQLIKDIAYAGLLTAHVGVLYIITKATEKACESVKPHQQRIRAKRAEAEKQGVTGSQR